MKKTIIPVIAALAAYTVLFPACRNNPAARAGADFSGALPNAEYPIDWTSTGKARLKDGRFEEAAAPGSAMKTVILLGGERAFGDLDGDGTEDAAVTLTVDPGGSGTFVYLAAVLNENGTARPVASVFLGDRIPVESLSVRSGKITVTTLTRGPGEPMAAKPTIEVERTFVLRDGELKEEPGPAGARRQ